MSRHTYDLDARLVGTDQGGVLTTYGHDPDGRRTVATQANTLTPTDRTWAYDARGELTRATSTSGVLILGPFGPQLGLVTKTDTTLRYDAEGALAATSGSHTAGAVAWDRSGPVPQVATTASATASPATHLHGPAGLVATVTNGSGTYVSRDPRGSVLSGSTTSYGAYGQPVGTPAADNLFGYRSELAIEGLVQLRARDYDPATARFLTKDPLDGVDGTPTLANPYHYADNDPLNRTDPLGLRPGDDEIGECAAISPLDGFDVSNPDAGFFERDRARQVLARRATIERWAGANGISSFLLATLVHHEGGNYLDPWRRGAAQGRDYALLGLEGLGLGSASVGVAQVQLDTARQVIAERYCGELDWSNFDVAAALIESDDFSISIAAGYLRLLKNDYPTAGDRSLFIAYAASRTSNRIMQHFDWDLRRLAREAAASFYVLGRFSVTIDGELLGMSPSTLDTLLRREEHWESSSQAMMRAGW